MNRSEYQELMEAARRRRLTAGEDARLQMHLAANPEAQREWDEERALDQILGQLNDVPVPSNFTARVLQAAQRAETHAPANPRASWLELGRSFFRAHRLAAAAALLVVALVTAQQYQQRQQARVVESLANLPNVEALQDYEAIARLSQVRGTVDEDLLAALQ